MMGLSDRERISMIRSAVLIQTTRVTDRRTDGRTKLAWLYIRAIAYNAVARKNRSLSDKVTKLLILAACFLWSTGYVKRDIKRTLRLNQATTPMCVFICDAQHRSWVRAELSTQSVDARWHIVTIQSRWVVRRHKLSANKISLWWLWAAVHAHECPLTTCGQRRNH